MLRVFLRSLPNAIGYKCFATCKRPTQGVNPTTTRGHPSSRASELSPTVPAINPLHCLSRGGRHTTESDHSGEFTGADEEFLNGARQKEYTGGHKSPHVRAHYRGILVV